MSVQVMTLVRVVCEDCEQDLTYLDEFWLEESLSEEVLLRERWTFKWSPTSRHSRDHRCPDCQKEQADG